MFDESDSRTHGGLPPVRFEVYTDLFDIPTVSIVSIVSHFIADYVILNFSTASQRKNGIQPRDTIDREIMIVNADEGERIIRCTKFSFDCRAGQWTVYARIDDTEYFKLDEFIEILRMILSNSVLLDFV